jgi:CubicO group peptidase (beta-lactamase class C family)
MAAAAVVATSAMPGSAMAEDAKDPAAFMLSQIAAGTAPGAALIASRAGKVLVQAYRGTYCSLHNRMEALTPEVLHPVYSYSKLVSATVAVIAHQEGRVDYDAPVSKFIPEFTGGGKDGITLRHLMTHSAGIPNVPLGPVRTQAEWDRALKAVCAASTEWEPGSRTAYHALSGMFTAAAVVRSQYGGRTWEDICQEKLFRPLDAHSLTFQVPADSAPAAITPQPVTLPESLANAYGLAGHPAGGCFATAADALKLLQLHLNNGRWGRRQIVRPAELAEMHRVQYQKEIDAARLAGHAPKHETWGLGPLLRGSGPAYGGHGWFGFQNQTSPGIFGHAGIDTVIGVADPATGIALFFATTASPPTSAAATAIRNGITDRVFAKLS